MQRAVCLCLVGLLLAGCSGGSGVPPRRTPSGSASLAPSPTATSPSASASPFVATGLGSPSVVASGLDVPWGIGFLPDDSALVAERDSGKIVQIRPGQQPRTVTRIAVAPGGEAGLLGLAVSPAYASDHLVFVYYTTTNDNRIARFPYDGQYAGAVQPILTGIPKGSIHDGGRLAVGPDGKLYAGTGETGRSNLAQQRDSLAGKILRINPDGSVPTDNPFGTPVWTYGHRNVEGLAWDAAGRMYASEFGPDRDDEVNQIVRGRNYGWPVAVGPSGGRFADPLLTFSTDEMSGSGAAIVAGSLWIAALRGERLWRIPLHADGSLGQPVAMLDGRYGRLRTVVAAPDGSLWVSTSNRDGRGDPGPSDDRILRFPLR